MGLIHWERPTGILIVAAASAAANSSAGHLPWRCCCGCCCCTSMRMMLISCRFVCVGVGDGGGGGVGMGVWVACLLLLPTRHVLRIGCFSLPLNPGYSGRIRPPRGGGINKLYPKNLEKISSVAKKFFLVLCWTSIKNMAEIRIQSEIKNESNKTQLLSHK